MANEVRIKDGGGKPIRACVHAPEDEVGGIVAYTREYDERIPRNKPFLNPTWGNAMNQNAAAGGTPVLIHNGTDTAAWTGAAGTGTWDFSDTTDPFAGANCVSLTSANNNDNATFTGAASVVGANYSAISLQIQLDTYVDVNHEILLEFALAGAPVGVPVSIDNYIDTAILGSYQAVIIPLTDLGVENETFDEATFTATRAGGSKPTFRIDNFQVEETGGIIEFTLIPDEGKDFWIDAVRLTMVNNVTGTAASNYNELLGVTLANGLTIIRTSRSNTVVGRNIANLYEFYAVGFNKIVSEEGATQTTLSLEIEFSPAVHLEGKFGDDIAFGVQDDLTGFTLMSAVARGRTNV
ncbi:MAG: hypothetical protein OCD76_07310 [Reichenbachiella sp.]